MENQFEETKEEPTVLFQVKFMCRKSVADAFDSKAIFNNRNRTLQIKELVEKFANAKLLEYHIAG